ncbi:MAG TPA: LPS export ABC transporter permease LptG [Paracoccaceae bacterium]|nr:LPS export ABC transporter permease LptG [Paracoccaceae bacterium]
MTLIGYILRRFLVATLAVQLVIAVIVILFSGIENLRSHADDDTTFGDIVVVTLLEAPEVIYLVFPLVVMLASLATFVSLARSSELVVLRAAGVSAIRLIMIPASAGFVLGILVVALGNPLVSAAMRQGEIYEEHLEADGPASLLSVGGGGVWLRQGDPEGQTVIRASRATADGTALSGVMLHRFDGQGSLYARIEAPSARLDQGEWVIRRATRWEYSEATNGFERTARDEELRLPTALTSTQILDSFSPPEMISIWDLPRFIGQIEDAGFSGLRHRLHLESELTKPILVAAMVLIGAAFSLRPHRFGQTGIMILLAVLAGFSLYFIRDFATSLGASGAVPLTIAVWAPPVAAILLALGLLLHLEEG